MQMTHTTKGIHNSADMLTLPIPAGVYRISYRYPAYRFTIKISRFIDMSIQIEKFLPNWRFGLGEAVFVDTMKLLSDSDAIQSAKNVYVT